MEKVIEDNSSYFRSIILKVGLRNTDQTAVENTGTDISRYINLCRPKDYQPATFRYFFSQVLEEHQKVKRPEGPGLRGEVVYDPQRGEVQFVRTGDWLDLPAVDMDPDDVLTVLMERYLTEQSPAGLHDSVCWIGVTKLP